MWREFLLEKLFKDRKQVEKIINIDNTENGTNYSFELLLNIIDKKLNIDVSNYDVALLEGNFLVLIDLLEKNNNIDIILTTLDNYGINKYIKKVYEEYSDINELNNIHIYITEHFNVKNKRIISIGSKAFINEMKNIYPYSYGLEFEL